MKAVVAICRILVGVLFIISGLIKANDALGFSYKLDEYFDVFGMPFLKPISLLMAMFICVFEVVCGVTTLTGSKMKPTAWALMLMIVFFTFLTFYSAYFNKVTDCGCFGDAIKLTPWGSFTKDIVLLILILPIFIHRNRITSLLPPMGDWAVIGVSALLTSWFTLHCYNHLPVKDFRPYAIGKNIREGMVLPPGAKTDSIAMVFIYQKDGNNVEVSMDGLKDLDSTYTFVDRLDKVIRKGDKAPIHDFTINRNGDDITDEVLDYEGYYLLLVCYNLEKTNADVFGKINEFAAKAEKNNIPFIALTASAPDVVERFRHENQTAFDFCGTDETTLKTMIRSNPGLMLLKKGTVMDMWHYNDMPTFEEFRKKHP
jgi:uncharacterized membrane protein YphA (DoxX/SURF4 family)